MFLEILASLAPDANARHSRTGTVVTDNGRLLEACGKAHVCYSNTETGSRIPNEQVGEEWTSNIVTHYPPISMVTNMFESNISNTRDLSKKLFIHI